MQTMSYLFFNGDCAKAFDFYRDTIGARIEGVTLNSQAASPEDRMPGGDDLVMNGMIVVGQSTIMASDAPGDWYQKPQGFRIHLEADSAAQAERVFAAFADGGSVAQPIGPTFWAERFGMVTDKFGTPWMVSFTGAAMAA
jgi:PhnB protein